MKTIWKFVLIPGQGLQTFGVPTDAKLICAREQGNNICVWAEVDTPNQHRQEERTFEVFATGQKWPDDAVANRVYLGSAHLHGGTLVFHVYERKP